jgi:L-lactate dehydrogenase (cytochrome)/(S)-mandelate dehydrogenase
VVLRLCAPSPGFGAQPRRRRRNLVDAGGTRASLASVLKQYRFMRPELTWDDIAWVREQWTGSFLVKGICHPDDARQAVALGADGVVVSNHGGRQLDGAVATLDVLPSVVAAVGDRATVLLDGGIRRGTDVVKALCLGARAVCIGRPGLYGLGYGGASGVARLLETLRQEIERTLTLIGAPSVRALDRSWLAPAVLDREPGDCVAGAAAVGAQAELEHVQVPDKSPNGEEGTRWS